jgi:hypothetical protein
MPGNCIIIQKVTKKAFLSPVQSHKEVKRDIMVACQEISTTNHSHRAALSWLGPRRKASIARSLPVGHILQAAAASHEDAFKAIGHQAVEQHAGSLEIAAFREGHNYLQLASLHPSDEINGLGSTPQLLHNPAI